jgi:DUF1680 family protein
VYCLEETDNGSNLAALYIEPSAELREEWREDTLGGTMLIRCRGKRLTSAPNQTGSFSCDMPPRFEDAELTALPYGSWGNRKTGEMLVWVHELM